MLHFYASGGTDSLSSTDGPAGAGAGLAPMAAVNPAMRLSRSDIVSCKEAAVRTVRVPAQVIQLVTDLRTYLQEKVEPPVYVSDRRLVKSIQLLQVSATTGGRHHSHACSGHGSLVGSRRLRV
jgi:MoxR-like ATPase